MEIKQKHCQNLKIDTKEYSNIFVTLWSGILQPGEETIAILCSCRAGQDIFNDQRKHKDTHNDQRKHKLVECEIAATGSTAAVQSTSTS